MLVAQEVSEGLTLVIHDRKLEAYDVAILLQIVFKFQEKKNY